MSRPSTIELLPPEIARLALALLRVEGAGKLLAECEGMRACGSGHKGGCSAETDAAIRQEVEGEFAS